jgi:hypothetical protein
MLEQWLAGDDVERFARETGGTPSGRDDCHNLRHPYYLK